MKFLCRLNFEEKNLKQNKNSGLHFVGLSTEVVTINGTKAVAITATSMYDTAKTLGSNRLSAGWFIYEGKVYVPLTLIQRIDTLTKNN